MPIRSRWCSASSALVVAVTAFVVFVERALRKIQVNYAKRQVGNKVYAGQQSFLPLKLNMAGVIPPIFASSIILFPATLGAVVRLEREHDLAARPGGDARARPAGARDPVRVGDHILLLLLYGAAVQPEGDRGEPEEERRVHSGYRPGEQTVEVHREDHACGLTLIGSLYLVVVCFIPNFLIAWKNVPFYFGGTSLLIIVVVTMDFMTQVQAYMMSQQYESLLKKANFKGGLPTR